MALNPKQKAFVEFYLSCWNATSAARQAGYSEKTARQQGSRLLSNDDVLAAIDARMKDLSLSANEVLMRLSDHARGSLGDFLTISDNGTPYPDFSQAETKLHLLKSIEFKPTEWGTGIKFEMYDAQAAAVHLGKYHKLFTDKVDHTSGGQPLAINIVETPARQLPPDEDGEDGDE
jgi:phage terminase small subunit